MEIKKTVISIVLTMFTVLFLHKLEIEIQVTGFVIIALTNYAMLTGISVSELITLINNFKYRVAFIWTN